MNSISSSLYEFQDPAFPPALPGEPETREFDRLFQSFDFVSEPLSLDLTHYFSPRYLTPVTLTPSPQEPMENTQSTHFVEEGLTAKEHEVVHGDAEVQKTEKAPRHYKTSEQERMRKRRYRETHKKEIKEYYQTNKIDIQKQQERYREAHQPEIQQRMKSIYQKNKEKRLAYQTEYVNTHREEIQEKREIKKAVEKLFLSDGREKTWPF